MMISGGVSKSGFPCPRFSASYCCASVFISVKTVVPNVDTRRAEVDIYNTPLDYSCGKFRTSYLLVVDSRSYYTCLLDFRQLCSDSISPNQAPFCPILLLDSKQEKAVGQMKEQPVEHPILA